MATAKGKYAYGICDKTGFRYKLNDLVFEMKNGIKTGLKVGKDVADPDHPQNFLGRLRIHDPQSVRDARPDRIEPAVVSMLGQDAFKTGSSGSSIITVTEINHGRSTSDTVRFRNVDPFDGITSADIQSASGYSITKVNADKYTVTVTGTATVGNITGGGSLSSAGPVTPLA